MLLTHADRLLKAYQTWEMTRKLLLLAALAYGYSVTALGQFFAQQAAAVFQPGAALTPCAYAGFAF